MTLSHVSLTRSLLFAPSPSSASCSAAFTVLTAARNKKLGNNNKDNNNKSCNQHNNNKKKNKHKKRNDNNKKKNALTLAATSSTSFAFRVSFTYSICTTSPSSYFFPPLLSPLLRLVCLAFYSDIFDKRLITEIQLDTRFY